jgi:hypothetical protein
VTARRLGRSLTAIAGIALLLLGTLPFSNWISAGLTDGLYARRWSEWGLGFAICAGISVVVALLSSSLRPKVARLVASLDHRLGASSAGFDLGVAMACLATYLVVAKSVFSGRPLLIDEIVQVLQARTYASGHLSVPTDSARAFFSLLHVVDIGDRTYSQFPPGWPAMMAVASLARAEWIAGPACGAIAVFVFSRLVRLIFPSRRNLQIASATLLFGLGPFVLFQFSSHMSHGPVVMWLLLAIFGVVRSQQIRWSPRHTALAGVATGCAFAVRPLDALAFGSVVTAWFGWQAVRDRRARRAFATMCIGGAVPVLLTMFVNAQTTGNPFTFGYEALWGSSHGLGFHAAPWGDAHTPARGVELLSIYATRLNTFLFESPFPALLPAILALLFVAELSLAEWLLFFGTATHAVLYFAYWHDGFFLGPRFVLPWAPLLVLLTLRAIALANSRVKSSRLRAALLGAGLGGVSIAAGIAIPARAAQYRNGLASMHTDYAAEAARANVSNSVVFVRESWGAQLISRMWALGVSRAATASLYSGVDACELEHAVAALEKGSARSERAESQLRPLLVAASRVQASSVSPDTTERMLPGLVYDETCSAHVRADREGYALYPPFLLDRDSGNLYVRDLFALDTVVMRRFSNRKFYIVQRDGVDGEARLIWRETGPESVISELRLR